MRGLAIPTEKLITTTLLKDYIFWARTSQIRWGYLLYHFTTSKRDFIPSPTIDSLLYGCINNISKPIAPLLRILLKTPTYNPPPQFLQSLSSIEDITDCMDALDESDVFTTEVPLTFLYSLLRRANTDDLRLKIESFIDKGCLLGQVGKGIDVEPGRVKGITGYKKINIATESNTIHVPYSSPTINSLSKSFLEGGGNLVSPPLPKDIKAFISSSATNIKGISDLLLEYHEQGIVGDDDLMEFIYLAHQRGEERVGIQLLESLGSAVSKDVHSFAIATMSASTTSPLPLPPFSPSSPLLIRILKANIKRCKWKSISTFLTNNSAALREIHLFLAMQVIARSNLKHKKSSIPQTSLPLLDDFDSLCEWSSFISRTKEMDRQSLLLCSLLKSEIYKKNPPTPKTVPFSDGIGNFGDVSSGSGSYSNNTNNNTNNNNNNNNNNKNAVKSIIPNSKRTSSGFCFNFFKVFSKIPPTNIDPINLYLTFHIERLSNKKSSRSFLKRKQKEGEVGGFYYRMKNASLNRRYDNVLFSPYNGGEEIHSSLIWAKTIIKWLKTNEINIEPSFLSNLVHLATITEDRELFSFILKWIDSNPVPIGRSFFRSLLPWFNGSNALSPPLMDSELTFSPTVELVGRFMEIIKKSLYKPDLSFYELLIPSLMDLQQWDDGVTLLVKAICSSYHHNYNDGHDSLLSLDDFVDLSITRLWNSLPYHDFVSLLERIKFESRKQITLPILIEKERRCIRRDDLLGLLLITSGDALINDSVIEFILSKNYYSSSIIGMIGKNNLHLLNVNNNNNTSYFSKRGVLYSKVIFQKAMSTLLSGNTPPYKLSISKSLSYLHNCLRTGEIEEAAEVFTYISTQHPSELTKPIFGLRRIGIIGHSAIQEW